MEIQTIQNKIYDIRGRKVMLDFELAALYGVETKRLKEAVRRNAARFEGDDFMFHLTWDELSRHQFGTLNNDDRSRSQIATLNRGRGSNIKYLPLAFTEVGVAMLSSVLRSETAIMINRSIMQAFVMARHYLASTAVMTAELAEIRTIVELLRRDGEDTLEAVNDLSEYTRGEIDNLYAAFAALSAKTPTIEKPRTPIGYPTKANAK